MWGLSTFNRCHFSRSLPLALQFGEHFMSTSVVTPTEGFSITRHNFLHCTLLFGNEKTKFILEFSIASALPRLLSGPHPSGPVAGNERDSSWKIPDARLHTTETETETIEAGGGDGAGEDCKAGSAIEVGIASSRLRCGSERRSCEGPSTSHQPPEAKGFPKSHLLSICPLLGVKLGSQLINNSSLSG